MLPESSYLPAIIEQPFDQLSTQLNFPVDQLRLVTCFILAIPLGQIHRLLHNTTVKHIYSIVLGALYAYLVCGPSSVHLWICSTLCYIALRLQPDQPFISTVIGMTYLSASHIYRLYVDYLGWSLDYTMCMMVLIVKTCTLAYNVYDGRQLRKLKPDQTLHRRTDLHQFRVDHSIDYIPSPLQFYSYIFFYAGVLVGPCFEYKDYEQFTSESVFRRDGLKSIPSTVLPSLKCVGRAMLCYIGIYVASVMPVMGYINTPAYTTSKNSFIHKCVYMFVSVTVVRFKYYFAWLMAEAGAVSTGLAYNGKHTDAKSGATAYNWDRVSNVNIVAVETATNFSIITNNWNLGVNNWLKHYVYFRVRSNKSVANLVTKAVSAFWHGFYSGYYLMFGTAWLINEADAVVQTQFSPYFYTLTAGKQKQYHSAVHQYVWIGLTWLWAQSALNYIACAFVLLRARWGIQAWLSIGFVMHIVAVAIVIVGKILTVMNKSSKRKIVTNVGQDTPADVVPEKKYELRSRTTGENGHHKSL